MVTRTPTRCAPVATPTTGRAASGRSQRAPSSTGRARRGWSSSSTPAAGCRSCAPWWDHDTPVAPTSIQTGDDLASLHRELAANVPFHGAGPAGAGAAADRNVTLSVRAPVPLDRLAAH